MNKIIQIIILLIFALLMISASCDKGSEGCTDLNACNYDDTAAINDGSCWSSNDGCGCEYPSGSIIDCMGICDADISNDPPVDDDGNCDQSVVGGCLDSLFCNYKLNATHNDGTCASDLSDFGGFSSGNDCNGDCNGTAVMDNCDLCIGGETNYGECWQIEIESIATFKLQNGMSIGSDTSSITIGSSQYASDGYNISPDDENSNCESNYGDASALIKSNMSANKNYFINFYIPHDGDDGWDEWWGTHFNFSRDIRANDYHTLFTEEKGMNWFSVIDPNLPDSINIENGIVNTYKTIMDSIKFQISHLEGIKCSQIKIYLEREKGESEGGIEYLVEDNQLGIWVESDKEINLMIHVSNICVQEEFDESCPDN